MGGAAYVTKTLRLFFSLFVVLVLGTFSLALLHPREAYSAQVTLSWVPPTTYTDGTPLTNLSGFKLYFGTASGSYSQILNVGNVTAYTASNLTNGLTYYFAATAYDTSGVESALSAEVSKTIPPSVQQYNLTITKSGTGSGMVSSSPVGINCGTGCSASFNAGTIVTLAAVPATGSTFLGWSEGGCSGNGTCSITLNASAAVTASFAADPATYTITTSSGGAVQGGGAILASTGGSISPSGTVTVNRGGSQTFTITPNSGYRVSDVKVDGTTVGAVRTYTFSNVTANHTISTTFAVNTTTYTITATGGSGGSISPLGTVTVNQGGSQTFTITPNSGYKIADVKIDGVSVGAVTSYTFSDVRVNHTVSATFADPTITYTITATAGIGGSISPSGTLIVSQGSSQTLTITPNKGYKVVDVKIDGVSVGAVTSYTFSDVRVNHTVSATFVLSSGAKRRR